MIHHVYRVENGNLVRFSLLPGGAVKKAQVLGDKLRLMSFEWTHLACPRTVYEEMVQRMELKISRNLDQKKAATLLEDHYHFSGKAGLIHPGLEVSRAEDLLGPAHKKTSDSIVWDSIQNEYHVRLDCAVQNEKIASIKPRGVHYVKPVMGTLRWVEVQLDADTKHESPKNLEKVLIDIAGELSDERFQSWCWAATELLEDYELESSNLRTAMLKRSKGTHSELQFLRSSEWEETRKWAAANLEEILRDSDEPFVANQYNFHMHYLSKRGADANSLFEFLWESDREKALKFATSILLSTKNAMTSDVLVSRAAEFEPELAQQVILQCLSFTVQEEKWRTIQFILEQIPDCTFTDINPILELVKELPEGPQNSMWESARSSALEALSE